MECQRRKLPISNLEALTSTPMILVAPQSLAPSATFMKATRTNQFMICFRQREMSCIPLNQLHLGQIQRLLSLLLLVPFSKQHQPLQVILLSTLVSLAPFHNEAFISEIEMTCFICTCSQIFGLCLLGNKDATKKT